MDYNLMIFLIIIAVGLIAILLFEVMILKPNGLINHGLNSNTPSIFNWNANFTQGDPVFIYAIYSNDSTLIISPILAFQVRALTPLQANTIMSNYIFQVETNITCYNCPIDLIRRQDLNFTLLGTVV